MLLSNLQISQTWVSNTGKSFVTGYDFSHRREFAKSLSYLGTKLPLQSSGYIFRCLVNHFNSKLEGYQGTQIVLRCTKELVSLLDNHIHDPDQIDIIMCIEIIPCFLVLCSIVYKLWARGFKAPYRLSKSTANALISLAVSCRCRLSPSLILSAKGDAWSAGFLQQDLDL